MTLLERQLAEALRRARPFVEQFYDYQHSIDEAIGALQTVDAALSEFDRQLTQETNNVTY